MEPPQLEGEGWKKLCDAHDKLARDIQKVDECVRDFGKMENGLEDVWGGCEYRPGLYESLKFAEREGYLEEVPDCCKQQVWYFVVAVAQRRKTYRNQACDTLKFLSKSPSWESCTNADLRQRRQQFLLHRNTSLVVYQNTL